MSQDQLFSAIEAVRTHLIEEITAQLAVLEGRGTQAVEDARCTAEKLAEDRWVSRVDGVQAGLLSVLRTIAAERSLSGTLNALLAGAASEAPRASLFVTRGGRIQSWGASGFSDESVGRQTATVVAEGALANAIAFRVAVLTTGAAPPAFADLRPERLGVAVPLIVGGAAVGVLYADEGVERAGAPAFRPRGVEILAQHASLCLAHLTALRMVQARSMSFHQELVQTFADGNPALLGGSA